MVIILLGFNAFAGEWEQGTLRQTLSLGIDGRRVLTWQAGMEAEMRDGHVASEETVWKPSEVFTAPAAI